MMLKSIVSAGLMSVFLSGAATAQSGTDVCAERWHRFEATGIAVYNGNEIVVDGATWEAMRYAEKEEVVATFHCLVPPLGTSDEQTLFLVSNMTNNMVGRWTSSTGLVVPE